MDTITGVRNWISKGLHVILPRLTETIYETLLDELLSVINSRPSDIFIVFCNTVPCCDFISRYLKTNDVDVMRLHGGFSATVS